MTTLVSSLFVAIDLLLDLIDDKVLALIWQHGLVGLGVLLWAEAGESLLSALGRSLFKLGLELLDALLGMPLEIEFGWRVVELPHFFEFAFNQVAIHEHLHDCATFVLCQSPNDITSHQSKLLDSDKLIEQGHNEVWIGIGRIPLKVL